MPVVTVLSVIALAFAIAAAGAVTALAVRGYLLARRLERLADQIGQTLEGDLRRALTEVAEAARGIRESAGNVDHTLAPLTGLSHRLERLAATLTAEALLGAVLSPALARAGGLLSGLRRGLGELVRHGRGSDGAR